MGTKKQRLLGLLTVLVILTIFGTRAPSTGFHTTGFSTAPARPATRSSPARTPEVAAHCRPTTCTLPPILVHAARRHRHAHPYKSFVSARFVTGFISRFKTRSNLGQNWAEIPNWAEQEIISETRSGANMPARALPTALSGQYKGSYYDLYML